MASKTAVQAAEKQKEGKHKPPPIDTNLPADSSNASGKPSPSPVTPGTARNEKEKKIGHRRVDEAGQVTYKKKPTTELMAAIQTGIAQSIGGLSSKQQRDLLMQDFTVVESVFFPGEGSNITPAHHYSDFRFKTYAPIGFRYFRDTFSIKPDDFLLSLCTDQLTELSNPGASGSIFYITEDDEFIIKTVQHKEAEFLQKLLPGYYMNLNQNPRTLLPKFYGLYCYQCGGKNIRFVVMNNLLPTSITLHEKYDLKGSTHKRKASKAERAKRSPTLKDLDFMANHPEGIMLEQETYQALANTIKRDCRVLESFKIMDYSMLLAIHNLDQAAHERKIAEREAQNQSSSPPGATTGEQAPGFQRGKSMKQRVANYSTAMESIQALSEPVEVDDDENIPPGGIPARNTKGERLLLFVGVIDILQNYRAKKKIEHAFKALVQDGDTISVHRPGFYAQRFISFFAERVFKKVTSLDQPSVVGAHARFRKLVHLALKHSPSKRKVPHHRTRSNTDADSKLDRQKSTEENPGAVGGGRPDLLPSMPDLPTGIDQKDVQPQQSSPTHLYPTSTRSDIIRTVQAAEDTKLSSSIASDSHRTASYKTALLEENNRTVTDSVASHSPNLSLSESTAAYTEEPSPSYTASSPSISCESLERDAISSKVTSPSLDNLEEVSDEDNNDNNIDGVALSDITLRPMDSATSRTLYGVGSDVTLTPEIINQASRRDKTYSSNISRIVVPSLKVTDETHGEHEDIETNTHKANIPKIDEVKITQENEQKEPV